MLTAALSIARRFLLYCLVTIEVILRMWLSYQLDEPEKPKWQKCAMFMLDEATREEILEKAQEMKQHAAIQKALEAQAQLEEAQEGVDELCGEDSAAAVSEATRPSTRWW